MQLDAAEPVLDRRTLRFADASLEAAYRRSAAVGERERRVGPLISVGLWLVGGVLAAAATSAPAAPIYAISLAMVAANGGMALLAPWAATYERQQLLGAGLNVLAGLAVLGLAALTATFDQYAAPALMLIAVFAFLVLRLQFQLAVTVGVVYIVAFLAFAIAVNAGTTVLDLFLVTAAVAVATGGTYSLEENRRRVFAQGRQIASLHQQVDQLFHRYLSPDVASALLGGGDILGGEVVEATILFADLQGFTSLSERSDPREIVELLNAYFDAAVPAIFNQGGSVIGFAGDAIVAVFNAPARQPDHALRACRAALDLQAAVDALPITGSRPRFRVGLNTGEVVVGSIGSDAMRNFTAIGDAVNVAARLQTYAQAGEVVLGQRTYEQVADCARVVRLGTPALKGKTEAIEVYQLISLCETTSGHYDGA
jgi:class 3 adenylate cyclase